MCHVTLILPYGSLVRKQATRQGVAHNNSTGWLLKGPLHYTIQNNTTSFELTILTTVPSTIKLDNNVGLTKNAKSCQ